MRKESLTLADCRERVLEENDITTARFRKTIFYWVGLSVVGSGGMAAILGFPLFLIEDTMPIWVYWLVALVCMVPATVLLSVLFFNLAKNRKRYQKILQCGVEIVEDTLNGIHIEERYKGRQYIQVYVLTFQSNGRYKVPDKDHYQWSKLYSMSPYGIYNTSLVGDTFYILRLKDASQKDAPQYEILEVYNTKLFELCEDGTAPRTGSSWRDSVSVE